VLGVSLGTVKSRLMRGREALKKRLQPYVEEVGSELGFERTAEAAPAREHRKAASGPAVEAVRVRQEVEIRP
jgi:hypothetical protein